MNDTRVVESVTNECQSLGRAHESSSARAEQLIACLEGEIAKRDARILELESQYQRDVYGLNNEGDPIGGDPAGGYASDNARLRSELAAIKAQEPVEYQQWSRYENWDRVDKAVFELGLLSSTPERFRALYAAPVSEAKAQGVVQWPNADEIMQMAFEEGQPADDASGYYFELEEFDLFIDRLMSEVARLNAAPVQQVSVPDWMASSRAFADRLYMAGWRDHADAQHSGVAGMYDELLSSSQAAPAADAGLVEALTELVSAANSVNKSRAHEVRGIQDDEPCYWQRKEWVDWLVTLGEQGRAALATHSAKGVV